MGNITEEPCPLWCVTYNSSFLGGVVNIIIVMFFPYLTLNTFNTVLCVCYRFSDKSPMAS